MNFIQGEKFISLADNKFVFYRNTEDVDYFFENECPDHEFVLISHNGDGAIRQTKQSRYDASLEKAPKNLRKWYAQNVLVKDDRLISLPIGLENSKWFPELRKTEKLKSILETNKTKLNTLYCNFNLDTNPSERTAAYEAVRRLSFCTTKMAKNGTDYADYVYNLYNHDFVLCPAGNGEDTHRLWETLYLGSIPIVKRTINTEYYTDLPICFIDDWKKITDLTFLNEEYERIKTNQKWNVDKLNFDFWKKIIGEHNDI